MASFGSADSRARVAASPRFDYPVPVSWSTDDMARKVEALRGALRRFGCERAILFGSAARGDQHEGSDLDVIVVRSTDLPFVERPRALLEMLPPALAVDVLVYTPEEFARLSKDPRGVLASALAEGVWICDRGPEPR
jgi:uncharacterized protein